MLAPAWDVDTAGRRAVEPKDVTKEKIGRSPDDADAVNLAYLETGDVSRGPPVPNPGPHPLPPLHEPEEQPRRVPFTPPDTYGYPPPRRERLFGRE
jgi:hypothetical protein